MVLPLRLVPKTSMFWWCSRSRATTRWACCPGRSARPSTTDSSSSSGTRAASSARVRTPGIAGSHGTWGTAQRPSRMTCWLAATTPSSTVAPVTGTGLRGPGTSEWSRTSIAASEPVRAGPPTYALWNSTSSRCSWRIARPGRSRGMWAASRRPMTSWLSASSFTRRATRTPTLARIRSLMTPAGRCVASTSRRPSDRPRAAMSTIPSTNAGISLASVANSSTTMSRSPGAASGERWRSSVRSRASPAARSSSRRRISASRACMTRRVRCWSRSVTTPTQCGRCIASLKAAPPL